MNNPYKFNTDNVQPDPYSANEGGDQYMKFSQSADVPDQTPQAAGAGAAANMNPYVMGASIGASFLTSYLNRKAEQFENQKQMAMKNQQNYLQNQDAGLNSLNNGWRAALLKQGIKWKRR